MHVYMLLLLCVGLPVLLCGAYQSDEAGCPARDLEVAPRLTPKQVEQLNDLYQKLKHLPCKELVAKLYNMKEPPIRLSDRQAKAIADYYPTYFKKPLNAIEKPRNIGCWKTSPDTEAGNICDMEDDIVAYNMAIDTNGNPVYIPQLNITGEDLVLEQQFQEYRCLQPNCLLNLQCKCEQRLAHFDPAVIYYVHNGLQLEEGNITLLDCAAYGLD